MIHCEITDFPGKLQGLFTLNQCVFLQKTIHCTGKMAAYYIKLNITERLHCNGDKSLQDLRLSEKMLAFENTNNQNVVTTIQ